MAWHNSTGKENYPSFYETRVVDRCIFAVKKRKKLKLP